MKYGMNARKQLWIAVICMTFVVILGTIGFMTIEEISLFQAFWMTMITVLTVGYGDAVPVTQAGKVFALLIIPVGVGIVTYAIGVVAAMIIEGNLFHAVRRKKMDKQIAQLKNHIIVCGCGRVGLQVVHELQEKKIPFVVVDKDESVLEKGKLLYIHGDATEDQVLHHAGISKAAGLVAIVANDAENVFITLTARGLNDAIKIVARSEKPETEEKLRRAGANKVINPSSMAGIHIAKGIANPLTVHYIDTVLYGIEQSFVIEEILVGKDSILVGKSLLESDVRNQFDVTILAILRNGDIIHNPTGQEKLQEHDMIIVFGLVEKLKQFEKELQSTR
ncbi:potassium channel protein [Bacillus thuringiensis]|uniref:Potassium channel protein n=5 Tax=Bacillus cereus group TaxID=86661 RepID=A0A9X6SMR1_BACTU|nr:potassium channel protein [Bacillus cereus]OTY39468.1 potassium channel protein [Bacillus thuringiensis serovar poloniensis]OTY45475.1 potassium channel protein [Bacillus thuringiensis serovar alesti]OTZ41002.1 potassium channel protein [Bacillus thuringiensis serovar thompsoni]OTZ98238.1 potassium channel protein [Bacillus thuringiensis serovar darmstadiensis]PDY99857.1 potassium channel protein [Bacillus thuringiensis]PEV00219.1 potassium channel protein [Bacillus sp. AFS012607]